MFVESSTTNSHRVFIIEPNTSKNKKGGSVVYEMFGTLLVPLVCESKVKFLISFILSRVKILLTFLK